MINYRVVLKDGNVEFKVKADDVALECTTDSTDNDGNTTPACPLYYYYNFLKFDRDEDDDEKNITVAAVAFNDVLYITSDS